ncbi:5'-nucleotidase C-terminal domain-containing protein [Caldifermentibacillus hisashii]|uniref:5'-nucleotidase C-terminal domain-containing protein n=1 Tax=Caldifermentibacillus hisashii TaxID=996558 RepID=UPI0034D44E30
MVRVKNRFLIIFAMIFALLVNYCIPLAQIASAADVNAISVEEAISNNTGTATVTGYIVGHTTAPNKYDFDAPFSEDTNIAIADSPTERDPAKIMPVKVKTEFRGKFGLQKNPNIVGKQVYITGELGEYFSVPAIKGISSIWFADEAPPVEEEPVEGKVVTISQIQGETHKSPYKDKLVKDVEGVVTYVADNNNFYMQSTTPDSNTNTSEGILVYKSGGHGQSVGNKVKVSGTVKEWVITDNKVGIDLPVTEINASAVSVVEQGVALPEPVKLDPPTSVIDNDSFSTFDPQQDGIDYYETVEGMLVSMDSPVVVGPQKYGEVPVVAKKVEDKTYTTEGGVLLTEETANPERIQLDLFDNNFKAKVGDQFNGTVTGVLTYDFSNFKVFANKSSLPELTERAYTKPISTLSGDEDSLTIASYNIENYSKREKDKTAKIAEQITKHLKSPDILGLVEMQDNDGATNSGTTDASQNYQALIDAIKAAGGPAYEWTDIAPANNEDGGQPGGNIRVGFLYNPDRVQLTEGKKGTATEAVDFENGSLTLNPGRIDPTNEAFEDSRKPLAAQFTFNGRDVIVIANHFNSKGGDTPLFGQTQPPTLSSEAQRINIAKVVNGFVSNILAEDPDANVVVLGDLNDFQFSNPIKTLKGNILENLIDRVPLKDRYTYNYEGNSQVLDHILTTKDIANDAQVEILHLNASYMEEHGRVSDHDPVLAQLNFDEEPAADEDFSLTIMHTNDTHARVTQFPYLATAVNQIRADHPNNLLLHAGDVFSGTLFFNVHLGLADLYFLNELKYDAMTFGNHEFDKDSQTLANFVNEAKFPFVSANIDFTNDPILGKYAFNEPGQPGDGGNIYPAIIKEINGEQVGIFGLTTEDTPNIASPSKNIVFENAVEEAENTVSLLEEKGIDKIIALSHLGYDEDKQLAEAVDGIDVIVGGHSHTVLPEGEVIEKDEPTVIVQTGEYLNNLGKLDVTFDENGVIKEESAELLSLTADSNGVRQFAADPAFQEKVDEFNTPIEELLQEVVGNTTVPLDGERANVRTKETNLGNLITDGMVWKMQQFFPETTIGLQNGGGIRASIDQGEITMGEVRTVLPFDNALVAIKLTGKEIWEALEHSVSAYPSQSGGFLHVSGLKFKFDPDKPAGERVWSVKVKTTDGNFKPIELDQMYTVATNSFTAQGGDGFDSLRQAYLDGRMINIDIPDYEVFNDYLVAHNPVSPSVEGRIVAAKEPSGENKVNPTINNGVATVDDATFKNAIEAAVVANSALEINLNGKENIKIQLTADQVAQLTENGVPLVLANGSVSIRIPSSILEAGGELVVIVNKLADTKGTVSPVYELIIQLGGKSITQFSEPVTLTFTVDKNKVTKPDKLNVYYYNEHTKAWVKLPGATYQDGKVTVTTNHFTKFTVFENDAEIIASDSSDNNGNGGSNPPGGKNPDNTNSGTKNTVTDHSNTGNNPINTTNKLPDTSTNYRNILLAGILFILFATIGVFYKRFKKGTTSTH